MPVPNDIGKDGEGRYTADKVVEEITCQGGESVSAPVTIASMDGAREIVDIALKSFGRLDILVNNAGMKAPNPMEHISEEQWDRQYQ